MLKAFGVQTLSGTGALRVAAEFLARQLKYDLFYFSKPTWGKFNLSASANMFCQNSERGRKRDREAGV